MIASLDAIVVFGDEQGTATIAGLRAEKTELVAALKEAPPDWRQAHLPGGS